MDRVLWIIQRMSKGEESSSEGTNVLFLRSEFISFEIKTFDTMCFNIKVST